MDHRLGVLLGSPDPGSVLSDQRCSGELARWLPEVDALYGVPQVASHHPEICTGVHTELVLQVAAEIRVSSAAMFAALVHDLGKALTPAEELPRHIGHEKAGLVPVREVCSRMRVPGTWQDLALVVCEYHLTAHRVFEMRPSKILKFIAAAGLSDQPGFTRDFVNACEADKRGRGGRQARPYPQGAFIGQLVAALGPLPAVGDGLSGGRDCSERHGLRLETVRRLIERMRPAPCGLA